MFMYSADCLKFGTISMNTLLDEHTVCIDSVIVFKRTISIYDFSRYLTLGF